MRWRSGSFSQYSRGSGWWQGDIAVMLPFLVVFGKELAGTVLAFVRLLSGLKVVFGVVMKQVVSNTPPKTSSRSSQDSDSLFASSTVAPGVAAVLLSSVSHSI